MDRNEIERIVAASIAELYARDLEIIQLDVAERTICARLAAILQNLCADLAVHAEYNRHGIEPKHIRLPDAHGILTLNRVSPDIIIHQPGHDRENVLVVEVKKNTNPIRDDADLEKLEQIKLQIGYQYALFLRIPTGPGAAVEGVRSVWV